MAVAVSMRIPGLKSSIGSKSSRKGIAVSLSWRQQEPRFVARSEVMRALETEIDCAARSDAKVLVTGETGVGKEVVARLIHQRSPRSGASMVALNCAGL